LEVCREETWAIKKAQNRDAKKRQEGWKFFVSRLGDGVGKTPLSLGVEAGGGGGLVEREGGRVPLKGNGRCM